MLALRAGIREVRGSNPTSGCKTGWWTQCLVLQMKRKKTNNLPPPSGPVYCRLAKVKDFTAAELHRRKIALTLHQSTISTRWRDSLADGFPWIQGESVRIYENQFQKVISVWIENQSKQIVSYLVLSLIHI